MKREETPPPSKRPGAARRRKKKVSGKPAQPARSKGEEPDMRGWTEGEKELYRLAISQGKSPIEDPSSLAYGSPQDGEELLAFHRQIRIDDARARQEKERRSTP